MSVVTDALFISAPGNWQLGRIARKIGVRSARTKAVQPFRKGGPGGRPAAICSPADVS